MFRGAERRGTSRSGRAFTFASWIADSAAAGRQTDTVALRPNHTRFLTHF